MSKRVAKLVAGIFVIIVFALVLLSCQSTPVILYVPWTDSGTGTTK